MSKYYHDKLLKIPIYDKSVRIVITNDEEKASDNLHINNGLFAHAIEWKGEGSDYGLWIVFNFEANKKISYGVIAHEVFHITNYILDFIGVVPDFKNDEQQAYLIEWLTNKVIEFIKRKGFDIV